MCDFRVDVDEVCWKHAVRPDVLLHANQRLCDPVAGGLVEIDGSIIFVSEEASILVRSVASAFDAYLESSDEPYSRAVCTAAERGYSRCGLSACFTSAALFEFPTAPAGTRLVST